MIIVYYIIYNVDLVYYTVIGDAMAALEDGGGVERAFSFHNIPRRPLGQAMLEKEYKNIKTK